MQLSETSHGPAAARHVVEALAKPSEGHWVLVPLQASDTSQPPVVAGRHTVPGLTRVSAGQAAPVPGQCSATSHAPAAGLHS